MSFVVLIVFDLVGIAAETDHQHVDNAGRPHRRRRDDVVHIEMTYTLFDPTDVLAAGRRIQDRSTYPAILSEQLRQIGIRRCRREYTAIAVSTDWTIVILRLACWYEQGAFDCNSRFGID